MSRCGFTVVELLITITIMGILLTLAVVNLNSTQANARDAERKGDAEALAMNLEDYYRNEDPALFFKGGGYYLGAALIADDTSVKAHLPDIDLKNTRAPGKSESDPTSFVAATNNVTTTTGVQPQPSASNDIYVYQPLTKDGALCDLPTNGDCRRFNLYYYQETTNTVEMITSKNQ